LRPHPFGFHLLDLLGRQRPVVLEIWKGSVALVSTFRTRTHRRRDYSVRPKHLRHRAVIPVRIRHFGRDHPRQRDVVEVNRSRAAEG
jgi:hypothetical protein